MVALAVGTAVGRVLGLGPRLAILVASGNAICGNSAIAAVAKIVGAQSEEVAAAIAFTAVLSVAAVLVLPGTVTLLALDSRSYGIFAGLTVYAVPQVIAATTPVSALSLQIGTLTKLIRVLMLGPAMLAISLLSPERTKERPPLHRLIPWFAVGFVLMCLLRSVQAVPESALPAISDATTILTVLAMAALGLSVELRGLARGGPRVAAASALTMILIGVLALLLVKAIPG
jgi:uncharacterized integral membrane protein (TIGR00698 family)